MSEKNNIDKLLTKGLRKRYFRKATVKDISFGIIRPKNEAYGNEKYIEVPLKIGLITTSFNIVLKWGKSTKTTKKWIEDNLETIINAKDEFNKTKDIQYLPKMVKPFVNSINDNYSQYWNGIDALLKIFIKIQTNKLSNAMKFGLLTEEGFKFVIKLNKEYEELKKAFNVFNSKYTQNAQNLQIIERWSGGSDLRYSLPNITRSLNSSIMLTRKLIKINKECYGEEIKN